MSDGVLVLDAKNRVVDINPAAGELIGVDELSTLGKPAESLPANWSQIMRQYRDVKDGRDEILMQVNPQRYLDFRITPLYDHNGSFTGRLILLQDISARKKAEAELQRAHQRLQAHLAEIEKLQAELREQVIRDPITGLFNRRYLEETLERELLHAARNDKPVGVIIMDIDGFKAFNDTHGHKAGDAMLEALGDLLRRSTQSGDGLALTH